MSTRALVDDFFRHEYGRVVSMLSCRFGVEHVEDIEDCVQSALMAALEHWTISGIPDNPSAWLFRAAQNSLLSTLRKGTRQRRILRERIAADSLAVDERGAFDPEEVQDNLLRMLFICCDDELSLESQLAFALKTLCGFSVREIAIRLFASESAIYKRLERARNRLRELRPDVAKVLSDQLLQRAPAVRQVLYLLFTEGYLSSRTEFALRCELCDEAIRLAEILAGRCTGGSAQTHALLALMHLHRARMSARLNNSGGLLLLEEQNRQLWDQRQIGEGLKWLACSARGQVFSRYHAEAGIAAEHCLAPSFAETRWDQIVRCYELLERSSDSPIHRLNRAVAIAEWKSPAEGLAILEGFEPPTWLVGSYMWSAVLADLHRRCGNTEEAKRHKAIAIASAPTPHVKQVLERRLA